MFVLVLSVILCVNQNNGGGGRFASTLPILSKPENVEREGRNRMEKVFFPSVILLEEEKTSEVGSKCLVDSYFPVMMSKSQMSIYDDDMMRMHVVNFLW